jgi:hypothetical protein
MVDIETLGVKPGCIILSIGAVEFNENVIIDQFHVRIDPLDAEKYGLKPEASTVMWWLDQDKDAQNSLFKEKGFPLRRALEMLREHFVWSNVDRVWCNGAGFDFPILKAAYEAAGLGTLPWAYWSEMDFRTFKNLFKKGDVKLAKVDPVLKHDALEDARAQAQTVMNLLRSVEEGKIQWAA